MDRREFLLHAQWAGGFWVLSSREGWAGDPPKQRAWPKSPFLEGNFGPVFKEVVHDQLRVEGQLPQGLEGLFVRNGPNPRFAPRGQYHWFDGDGMLHGLFIQGGQARYRNRWVRTASFLEEEQAGEALYAGIMDPPTVNASGIKSPLNKANTSVVWHDGKLLALWEGGPPYEVQAPKLETVGPYTYLNKLKHAFTAHPKVDARTGEMFLFGYNLVRKPYLQYSVVNAKGQLCHTQPIDLEMPVMMHDFAITENYALFMDLPEVFDLKRAMRGQHPLIFMKERGSRFGIVPRAGGAVRWFPSPACFVFHVLNAYEEGDEIILHACRMAEFPDVLSADDGRKKKDDEGVNPILYEWRFNLVNGKVHEGPIDHLPVEFPRVADALVGRKTRFGYTGYTKGSEPMFCGFAKFDLTQKTKQLHALGAGRYAGEGVFVPKPDAKTEEDGWLLSLVYDQSRQSSELIVLDAADWLRPPLARVLLPVRVPFGFHGIWIDAKFLS